MEFKVEPLYDDGYEVSFSTPFIYGDVVAFESPEAGAVEGVIAEILLAGDGIRYYHVRLPDGHLQPGLRAQELRLIRRGGRY
jgi:hypothetical protein